ncbi:MAG: hypothetical protein M3253_07835 [Chloroflexota bacterium]|nr:hypothetical protein [Chloroflexota bacterium]
MSAGASSSTVRVVVAGNACAAYPQAGGLWSWMLQYVIGLRDLGHEVLWLELLTQPNGGRVPDRRVELFLRRTKALGLGGCAVAVEIRGGDAAYPERWIAAGGRSDAWLSQLRSADVVWNLAGALPRAMFEQLAGMKVFLDGDPGHLQVSALDWDLGLDRHDAHFSVGLNVGQPDCEVPTLGLRWQPFPPPVHLPLWPVTSPEENAPITSVTQWNWEEIWLDGRVLSISKREAYMRYAELPRVTGRRFELAANIHPSDPTHDRATLIESGWTIVDPHTVAGTPARYRRYVRRSRAELSCPKPVFRELRTGWLSDRSAAYLASGRPVIAEDTGLAPHLPTGEGLLTFADLAGAAAAVESLDAQPARHQRAARELAAAYLSSSLVLPRMVEASLSARAPVVAP